LIALIACTGEAPPSLDAGAAGADAGPAAPDASQGRDAGGGDSAAPQTDTGFEPTGDCLDHSECDDGAYCNGAETCTDGVCVDAEPPCQIRGCLSACDEINGRCLDESVAQDHLCDEIHCATATCGRRGTCSYESLPGFQCNTSEMQVCQSHYQCRDGLDCFGGQFFQDQSDRCLEPCTGTEDCDLGITKCEETLGDQPFNHCLYNLCGGRFGGTLLAACDGSGQGSGSCYPLPDGRGGYLGVCYEGGSRAEGETCSGGTYPWPLRGQTQGRCQGGLWCHGGQCRSLCSLAGGSRLPSCPETDHCGDAQEGENNDAGICLPGARCVVIQRHCGTAAACAPDSTTSLLGGCRATAQPSFAQGAGCQIPEPGEPSPCADGTMCWLDFRNPLTGARCLAFCDLLQPSCAAGSSCRATDSRRNPQRGEKLGLCYPNQ
jgi:hypothetical protein